MRGRAAGVKEEKTIHKAALCELFFLLTSMLVLTLLYFQASLLTWPAGCGCPTPDRVLPRQALLTLK